MSDSPLLKPSAKPSGDGHHVPEAHVDAHKDKGPVETRNFKQELHEQKAINQASLLKIHGELPLTTIGDAKHASGMKHVDYGNGVKRDIKFGKDGTTVVGVVNPVTGEVWKKENKGWTVSEKPGDKPWHAEHMTVAYNPITQELKWKVNSKESFKRLDKQETKFHDPNADTKKTQQSRKVSSAEHQLDSIPIINMQKLSKGDGSEAHVGSQGAAFTTPEANKKALDAAGLSDSQLKSANVVFTNQEEWIKALKKSNLNSIPGVDPGVVDAYSQLAARTENSKHVGVFNKIIDFDKKELQAVIKGIHGDKSNTQKHDGRFHQYYEALEKKWKSYVAWSKKEVRETLGLFPDNVSDAEKFAVAVVAQGEAPRKTGQSHEDRFACANLDSNKKAGRDFWFLQNNENSDALQTLVKAMHKDDPVQFKQIFGSHSDLVLTDLKHALAYSDVRKHMEDAGRAYADVQLKNGADRFQDTRRVLAEANGANYGQYGDNLKVLTLAFILKNRFSPEKFKARLNNVDLSRAKNTEDALVLLSSAFCHKVDATTGRTLHDGRLNADKELALVNAVVPDVNIKDNQELVSWAP